jgi:hypothetical protein
MPVRLWTPWRCKSNDLAHFQFLLLMPNLNVNSRNISSVDVIMLEPTDAKRSRRRPRWPPPGVADGLAITVVASAPAPAPAFPGAAVDCIGTITACTDRIAPPNVREAPPPMRWSDIRRKAVPRSARSTGDLPRAVQRPLTGITADTTATVINSGTIWRERHGH